MAVRQLYYTSCVHGLSGYTGFQFNAVSPGVGAELMQLVEQSTGYQRPRETRDGAEPVNLCHLGADDRSATTARVVYTGLDPSGRPGNYFVHAIATDNRDRDLAGLRPIELWSAPAWSSTTVDATELPLLSTPLVPGPVDRITVAEFLDRSGEAAEILPELLTAAVEAVNGGRRIVLRSASSEDNAFWIAAVSFLLDADTCWKLSFSTFTARPDRSRLCLTGTVADPDSDSVLATLRASHVVVDVLRRGRTGIVPHPAVGMLIESGTVRAAGLWHHAAVLADGTERTFDDWHPVLVLARLLDGGSRAVTVDDVHAAIGWVRRRVEVVTPPLPTSVAGAALRVLSDRSSEISAEALRHLAALAGYSSDLDEVDRIERLLLDQAVDALAACRMPSPLVDPVTDYGRAAARARVTTLLDSSGPAVALAALQWCRRSAVSPAPEQVHRTARDGFGPELETLDREQLVGLCRADQEIGPVVVDGLADHLDGDPARMVRLLDDGVDRVFLGADLTRHPGLRECLIIHQARTGQMSPLAALGRIAAMRGRNDDPVRDADVLAGLWPVRRWSVDEATQLIGRLGDRPGAAVGYLVPVLDEGPTADTLDTWFDLVAEVCRQPVLHHLPAPRSDRLPTLRALRDTLSEAERRTRRGEAGAVRVADAAIGGQPAAIRAVLRGRLADVVLSSAPDIAPPLADCSDALFDLVRERAARALVVESPDLSLAVRLFLAGVALKSTSRYRRFMVDTLVPAFTEWSYRHRRNLKHELAKSPVPPTVTTVGSTGVTEEHRGPWPKLRLPSSLPLPRRTSSHPLVVLFDDLLRSGGRSAQAGPVT